MGKDLARREFLLSSTFAGVAFAASALRWFTMPSAAFLGQGSRRIGSSDVAALREVTDLFRKLDNRWGGGRARTTVVQYLADEVTPMLREGRYTEQAGRELFSAAAEMTRLAGWMAYDLEQHGLAQRYLIQELQLARDGWDFALGAEILAAMSHQALYVARPGEAADLARAAQISARKAGLPALLAETLIMEAHALAVLPGERSASVKAIEAAEHQYSHHESADEPTWLGYFDEAYLSARIAHCLRDLGMWKPAEAYARRSLSMADGYDRGRMFNLAILATIHGKRGDVEHACAAGMQAIQLAAGLRSARSRRYIADVRRVLRPHCTSQAVRAFAERARQLLPARQDV